ncbi:FecR family protein [Pedobacter sp.]|jgi:transmembrane sensor|uniref:FecR family protein n=1 Tax=Pedobacter sp. TaxID=1411316 RepID=UPI002CB83A4F|nr:FecR domain-containing protein [Pedobacter sp.]HWW40353.1 FecR domain-containing protein [Pedobacter sp.]
MQVSDQNTFLKLIEKYLKGAASAEEVDVLESYYELFNEAPNASDRFSVSDLQKIEAGLKSGVESKIQSSENVATGSIRKRITQQLWPRIAAAAAILLIVGLSIFFYTSYYAPRHPDAGQDLGLAGNDIKPGSNKAYLILSNGKRLSLTDAANGAIAKEAGVEITKTADGQVIYESRTSYSNALNTIETPKGGQYQIRLPDGSKVWLNAASKLIYPVTFIGRGQREVTLSGEAYFEIAKDKQHPFKVKSIGQIVEVLGTHFNINSYADEPVVKTTLLEGSVAVRHVEGNAATRDLSSLRDDVFLKPGQQASLTGAAIKVTDVNPDDAIAWKNGEFVFNDEPLQNIMRKIARWYDVDIIYKDINPNKPFGGSVSRFENISKVLEKLELTGSVHFKIEGKTIYVTK